MKCLFKRLFFWCNILLKEKLNFFHNKFIIEKVT